MADTRASAPTIHPRIPMPIKLCALISRYASQMRSSSRSVLSLPTIDSGDRQLPSREHIPLKAGNHQPRLLDGTLAAVCDDRRVRHTSWPRTLPCVLSSRWSLRCRGLFGRLSRCLASHGGRRAQGAHEAGAMVPRRLPRRARCGREHFVVGCAHERRIVKGSAVDDVVRVHIIYDLACGWCALVIPCTSSEF